MTLTRPATLVDALERVAGVGGRGYRLLDGRGGEVFWSYTELVDRARARGGALLAAGLVPGDRLGVVTVSPGEFMVSFLGAVAAGLVPVPMAAPLGKAGIAKHRPVMRGILHAGMCAGVVADPALASALAPLTDEVPGLHTVLALDQLDSHHRLELHVTAPQDMAFIQFTSGSTSDPKGVVVTHDMLMRNNWITNVEVNGAHPERDVGVTWLPLFHDMGLSCATSALVVGMDLAILPTTAFARWPNQWLATVDRLRAAITYAPNFGYVLAHLAATRRQLDAWDLSCLRVMGCGAEPIQPDAMRAFVDKFSTRCALRPEAISASYGLAESTVATTLTSVTRGLTIDRVDAAVLEREGRAVAPGGGGVTELVACGEPIPHHEVVIVGPDGAAAPDRVVGEVQVRGPSVTPGYFNNPEATAEILHEGWLRTGDLGYFADGLLYITGRVKDLIIIRGRNHHPQNIEWAAGATEGVRAGGVIAFSRPAADTEELVVLAESYVRDAERAAAIRADLLQRVRRAVEVSPRDVVLVAAGSLPRTSSGKLRRQLARRQYLDGALQRNIPRPL